MSRPSAVVSRDYFLPDLCAGPAVLWLVLGAALLALVLALARTGLVHFDWVDFALILMLVEWSVLLTAAALCRGRAVLARQGLAVASGAVLVMAALVTMLVSLGGQGLLAAMAGTRGWSPPWWSVLGHGLIAALLAGMLARYFYLTHQLRRREQAALSAQVEALTARIRPHFLFNCLNSIASLVGEDARAAERAVEDLAALFRASLSDADVVSLEEERALCERYLRIEQLRLGARLAVEWQLSLPAATPIPALALQPLLENAIYHGIQRLPAGGRVLISGGREENGWVTITVTNPCMPPPSPPASGRRLATDNIRRRLRALFGDDAQLYLRRHDNEFVAQLHYRPREERK